MAAKDKALIERLALHIAEEAGQLGYHDERWYDDQQRDMYQHRAKNIVTLLRNEGFVIKHRSDR